MRFLKFMEIFLNLKWKETEDIRWALGIIGLGFLFVLICYGVMYLINLILHSFPIMITMLIIIVAVCASILFYYFLKWIIKNIKKAWTLSSIPMLSPEDYL